MELCAIACVAQMLISTFGATTAIGMQVLALGENLIVSTASSIDEKTPVDAWFN